MGARAGLGDEFWQYRPAHAGDSARMIDWRRSARSDAHFVREREWQAAQSVTIWVDPAKSMGFSGAKDRAPKSDRAKLLALALAVCCCAAASGWGLRAWPRRAPGGRSWCGWRRGWPGMPRRRGLWRPRNRGHGQPWPRRVPVGFPGRSGGIEAGLARAADRGVKGVLIQVLDPAEEEFPFDGRTIFESMGGTLRHETQQAGDLRDRYLARLAERKDRLAQLARRSAGISPRITPAARRIGALWAYQALEGGR
jgi:uncharacterized protein (DUF58 family)